jgi:hypothetical protein
MVSWLDVLYSHEINLFWVNLITPRMTSSTLPTQVKVVLLGDSGIIAKIEA